MANVPDVMSLEDFQLPPDHQLVVVARDAALAQVERKQQLSQWQKEKRRKLDWHSLHATTYRKHSFVWVHPSENSVIQEWCKLNPFFAALGHREQDVLYYWFLREGEARTEEATINLPARPTYQLLV
eukprot:12982736-Alexandrium_andersonii.AAC.1